MTKEFSISFAFSTLAFFVAPYAAQVCLIKFFGINYTYFTLLCAVFLITQARNLLR